MRATTDKQEIFIAGPAGKLQAMVETPAAASSAAIAIVCHPHPQHQGTMQNKVVHTLVRAFNELGMPALRFNFRGVGDSQGSYASGDGEADDLQAVAGFAAQRWPGAEVWLAGFSFGAVIAARKASELKVAQLVCIAPAVNMLVRNLPAKPAMPWLIVQGDADEIVPVEDVRAWVAENQPGPELLVLPGVGHFFHGALVTLRKLLVQKYGANSAS